MDEEREVGLISVAVWSLVVVGLLVLTWLAAHHHAK
jgi:hypothetical protein